ILSSTSFGGSAQFEHELMFHGELTTLNPQSTLEPRLATQVPSLNDGTWKVFDDGRMELTWTLKPNVVWHDGTPLTADDFVFGTTVARDPALATTTRAAGTRQISEVVAVDPHTLVVRYPKPYVNANMGENTPALPAHLLRDAYQRGDRAGFESLP